MADELERSMMEEFEGAVASGNMQDIVDKLDDILGSRLPFDVQKRAVSLAPMAAILFVAGQYNWDDKPEIGLRAIIESPECHLAIACFIFLQGEPDAYDDTEGETKEDMTVMGLLLSIQDRINSGFYVPGSPNGEINEQDGFFREIMAFVPAGEGEGTGGEVSDIWRLDGAIVNARSLGYRA